VGQCDSLGRSKATISQKKSFALWRKHCDLEQPRLPTSVLTTGEPPSLELFALGLLTLGLALLLLLMSDSVLVVLPVYRTDTALSEHLLLTLGLTLGLALQELHVETLVLLLLGDNSVLAVLLVD